MLNRIYLQTKKEYDSAASQIRTSISERFGIEIPDFTIHEIIELDGDISESALSALKSSLIFPYCETASSKHGQVDSTFTVMMCAGRSDERKEEITELLRLCGCNKVSVRTGKEYCFERKLTQREYKTVSTYLRDPVTEVVPSGRDDHPETAPENEIAEGFNSAQYTELADFKEKYSLELDIDDMMSIQNYFLSESREPTFAEINIIDRFFSETFRHITFETILDKVDFQDTGAKTAWDNYRALSKSGACSLSDMTRTAAECIKHDTEINIGGRIRGIKIKNDSGSDLLLTLRIVSRNDSVTAEPYSGAAYCFGANLLGMLCRLGDVYDACRVSGTDQTDSATFRTEKSLSGYSELAAKTGIPCSRSTHLTGDAFSDKKLEISALLATSDLAALSHVASAQTEPGDLIFLLGGKTGKDGSLCTRLPDQTEDGETHENVKGEFVPVSQPGILNALYRLCTRAETAGLVRVIYQVGRGGIACAIGRIANGAEVKAEKIPLKYDGLSVSEIMLSESCERVIAAVSPDNASRFRALCKEENILCTEIAAVNGSERFVVTLNDRRIVSLTHDFLINGGTEKHLSAIVEKPAQVPQSEALRIARAPLDGVSPIKKLFSKDIKCDFPGAVKAASVELSPLTDNNICLRFDETAGNNIMFAPYSEKAPEASVRYITRAGKNVTNKGTPLCSAFGCGLFPEISIADPYKGAYLSVTEAVLKLAASGYGASHPFMALQEYIPEYRNNSKQFGIAIASLLGAVEAQVALEVSSLGGKLSMGNSVKAEKHSTVTAFAVCVGIRDTAVTKDLKKSGHRVIMLRPEYDKSGIIPLPESQKNIISIFTDMVKAHNISAAATVTGRCPVTALLEMCRASGLGFEFDNDRTPEQLFDYCYGAIIAEIEDTAELPKDAVYLGTVTNAYELTYHKDSVSLSELFRASETEASGFAKAAEDLSEKRRFLYLRKPVGEYGMVRTVSGSSVNVLIPVNGYSVDIRDVKAIFEAAGNSAGVVVKTECVPYGPGSLERLISAIDHADILYIPDCRGYSAVTNAVFSLPKIKENLNALRTRGGLIYGAGNGTEALILSGMLDADIERIGVCNSPFPVDINTTCRVRAVSSLSPFMRLCQPGEVYDSVITGRHLRLTGDEEYLASLAYDGRIAVQYSGQNILESALSIDALTSADGRVFAQLSRPERLISAGKHKVLPTILSAVRYFSIDTNGNTDEIK